MAGGVFFSSLLSLQFFFLYQAVSHKSYARFRILNSAKWLAEQQKYWRLRVEFLLMVWFQFSIRFNSWLAHGWSSWKEDENGKKQQTNANRDPEKRNPHFSQTVEVKRDDEARLQSLRGRLDLAKSLLGIDCKTLSMQNANLLERLLNCFELVIPSAVGVGPSSAPSISSLPHEVQPPPKSLLEQQHWRPDQRAQKRQIYVDSTVDDPFYVCTGESLKSLVKYLTRNPQCEFCGEEYRLSGLSLPKQGHVCRLELPCVWDDSVVWLSSGLLSHPAKYVANVR